MVTGTSYYILNSKLGMQNAGYSPIDLFYVHFAFFSLLFGYLLAIF